MYRCRSPTASSRRLPIPSPFDYSTGLVHVFQQLVAAVGADNVDSVRGRIRRLHEPVAVGIEGDVIRRDIIDDKCCRSFPERLEDEKPSVEILASSRLAVA